MEIRKVFVSTQRGIPLGYQGENEVTEVVFPQPEELLEYNWTLLHQLFLKRKRLPAHSGTISSILPGWSSGASVAVLTATATRWSQQKLPSEPWTRFGGVWACR